MVCNWHSRNRVVKTHLSYINGVWRINNTDHQHQKKKRSYQPLVFLLMFWLFEWAGFKYPSIGLWDWPKSTNKKTTNVGWWYRTFSIWLIKKLSYITNDFTSLFYITFIGKIILKNVVYLRSTSPLHHHYYFYCSSL